MKYSTRDAILGVHRSFLASTRDQKRLHFQYEESDDTPALPSAASMPAQVSVPVTSVQQVADPGTTHTMIPDEEVSSLDRLHAAIAYKLKKGRDAVMPSRSIKEITAGRDHHVH